MIAKKKVRQFLESLQWKRMTKKELELELSEFFKQKISLEDFTDLDFEETDYSFIGTTAIEPFEDCNYIDFEIYYLKMRKRGMFLITGTEILEYVV